MINEGYLKFHDCHKGETGLVVANGPSLENVPIEFLKSYITLGCNRITALAPEFVPNYYACLGHTQIDTGAKRETMIPMLMHPDLKAAFLNRLYIHLFPMEHVYSILGGRFYGIEETRFFSFDPLNITGLGYTMTFVLLQIAFYMGFERVLLVGLDHNYPDSSKKHFYDDSEFPDFEIAPGPVYEWDNEKWQGGANIILSMANEVYNEQGREIINITSDSHCEVFRQEALSKWEHKD
jgi:hypothetical protein